MWASATVNLINVASTPNSANARSFGDQTRLRTTDRGSFIAAAVASGSSTEIRGRGYTRTHNTSVGSTSGDVAADHRDSSPLPGLVMFSHRQTSSTEDDVHSLGIRPPQHVPTEWERSSRRHLSRRRRAGAHARAHRRCRPLDGVSGSWDLGGGDGFVHKTDTPVHVQLFIIIIIDRHRVISSVILYLIII